MEVKLPISNGMKVILLRDVAKIGRRHEVVEVPDGYALNQLIPKKWAETATPANLKKIEARNEVVSQHHKLEDDQFAKAVESLTLAVLTVTVPQVNEQGHLFKAIQVGDIVAAAHTRGVLLTSSQIQFKAPLKSLGTHEIELKHKGVKKAVMVEIIKA
jgi:large subunit ribosomal protein L9